MDSQFADVSLNGNTDVLFRPHQVAVHHDREAKRATLYYAIDDYFGPKGSVIIYDQVSEPNLWRYDDWDR